MRLAFKKNKNSFDLTDEYYDDPPPYAILSHTWSTTERNEVTHKDFISGRADQKPAFKKITFCADLAAEHELKYFWIDTFCFDKSSSAELNETIGAMFTYYSEAKVCFVYLSDFDERRGLKECKWFTRGWTLQELLAPKTVKFYGPDREFIGTKQSLAAEIHDITGIPKDALTGNKTLSNFSRMERLGWAEGRMTKRVEDRAYSLFGVVDAYTYIAYGERQRAFRRLKKEIRILDEEDELERSRRKTDPRATAQSSKATNAPAKPSSGSSAYFTASETRHRSEPRTQQIQSRSSRNEERTDDEDESSSNEDEPSVSVPKNSKKDSPRNAVRERNYTTSRQPPSASRGGVEEPGYPRRDVKQDGASFRGKDESYSESGLSKLQNLEQKILSASRIKDREEYNKLIIDFAVIQFSLSPVQAGQRPVSTISDVQKWSDQEKAEFKRIYNEVKTYFDGRGGSSGGALVSRSRNPATDPRNQAVENPRMNGTLPYFTAQYYNTSPRPNELRTGDGNKGPRSQAGRQPTEDPENEGDSDDEIGTRRRQTARPRIAGFPEASRIAGRPQYNTSSQVVAAGR